MAGQICCHNAEELPQRRMHTSSALQDVKVFLEAVRLLRPVVLQHMHLEGFTKHTACCRRSAAGCIEASPGAIASLHVKKACSRSMKTCETRCHLAARASACPSQLMVLLPCGAAGSAAEAGATGAPEPPDLQPRPTTSEFLSYGHAAERAAAASASGLPGPQSCSPQQHQLSL